MKMGSEKDTGTVTEKKIFKKHKDEEKQTLKDL